MKKPLVVTICILTLVFTIAAASMGTVNALKADFTANSYISTNPVTIDGTWTNANEWSDSAQYPLAAGLNGVYRLKWLAADDFSYIYQYFLVEIVGDTTSDAADTAVVCYDAAAELFGTPIGGAAPTSECWKFEVNGTGATATLNIYKGTGTGWANYAGWTKPTNFDAAVTIAASALSATPHKIIEFRMEHISLAVNPTTWILVAGYDASNSASGLQVWPTSSSPNVPNDYGLLSSSFEPIPEGFGFLAVMALSSVAVVVGSVCIRKKSKTKASN